MSLPLLANPRVPVKSASRKGPAKLLSIIEANSLTGPARNLLSFCGAANNRMDVSVIVLTGALPNQEPALFTRVARDSGLDVVQIEERHRFDRNLLPRLRREIAARRPDIVETHSIKPHFLARLLGIHKTYPWVAFHHGYTNTFPRVRLYNHLDDWSLPKATRVISLSAAFRGQLIGRGVRENRIRVVGSSISPDWGADSAVSPSELRERFGFRPEDRIILSVGRLSLEKGHIQLVTAFAQLCKENPSLPARLLIVGVGPEQQVLEAAAQSFGVADRIVFAGHSDEIAPFYRLADVFALPSYSEGSPLALLETMVSGVPAVVTRVGGVPEMVTPDSAMLVEPRQPAAMAAALALVLQNPGLAAKLADAAREIARTRFAPEPRADQLMQVYEEALR